jgi:hypothetical protein
MDGVFSPAAGSFIPNGISHSPPAFARYGAMEGFLQEAGGHHASRSCGPQRPHAQSRAIAPRVVCRLCAHRAGHHAPSPLHPTSTPCPAGHHALSLSEYCKESNARSLRGGGGKLAKLKTLTYGFTIFSRSKLEYTI